MAFVTRSCCRTFPISDRARNEHHAPRTIGWQLAGPLPSTAKWRCSQRLSWSVLHEIMGLIGASLGVRPCYDAVPTTVRTR